jgi:hypothetical protein
MHIFSIAVLTLFAAFSYAPAKALSSETGMGTARMRGIGISISPEGAELGVVTAGTHSGSTLYTTKTDIGVFRWCANHENTTQNPEEENKDFLATVIQGVGSEYCYSGGSGKDIKGTYATSPNDGMENVEIIMNLTASTEGLSLINFPAMAACRQLGEDWYLPSIEEMKVLFDRRHDIGGFQIDVPYWSSTEFPNYGARVMSFDNYGKSRFQSAHKAEALPVRCIAREKIRAR